MGTIFI